ncbi:MAG TPA: metalloregulator ArsR/SmtB family transcription factor [Acidimicrobiales bacterium]|nr:metalloregulator ArsR/SmtB family transcription factor [Acidimicrobiales bacterium]
MPLIHTDSARPRGPRVAVEASVAIELEWALASAEREDFRHDHPVLDAVYRETPGLRERVQGMWGPAEALRCGGFMELMVLAHHGGSLLSTDAEGLLERLPGLCTTAPATAAQLPLRSETAADRAAVLRRLARLRESGELRAQYVAVVRAMWEAVHPHWERLGRPSVDAAVAERRALAARGADWHEIARSDCDCGELLETTVNALGPGDGLCVVPAFFTHKGLFVDLPGLVVVGVRTDTSGVEARARTEALARRLKAISDPTRLAILDTLRSGPRTVTEIAGAFSLAQPTVSNHVKQLREAGLVTDTRQGTRRQLVVQDDNVAELIARLHDALGDRRSVHGVHEGGG